MKNVHIVVIALGHQLMIVRILHRIGGVNVIHSEDILIPYITFYLALINSHMLV